MLLKKRWVYFVEAIGVLDGVGTSPEDLSDSDINLLVIKLNNVSMVDLIELMSTFERPFARLSPACNLNIGSKLDTDAPECMWFYAKHVYMYARDYCYSRRNKMGYMGEKIPTSNVLEELVNF